MQEETLCRDLEALPTESVLLIPSLNPTEQFISLIDRFKEVFKTIIIVNDGSAADDVFIKIKQLDAEGGIHLLTHEANKGKGAALKTGFGYYLEHLSDSHVGVVTADSDGQHRIEDILIVKKALEKSHQNVIHMGVRDLQSDIMPTRSKFGNKWSAFLFRTLYGIDLSDTQSGLRGFSNDTVTWLKDVKGKRFEYEMKMLIDSKKHNTAIMEHPIETRYEKNHTSTFKTFQDSMRVLFILLGSMLKFILAAGVAGIADVGVFYVMLRFVCSGMSEWIGLLIATVSARVTSSIINFIMNRYVTFTGNQVSRTSVFKYYSLWFVQMGASYGLLYLFTRVFPYCPEVIIKVIADLGLALISYQVQLKWVFRSKQLKTDRRKFRK